MKHNVTKFEVDGKHYTYLDTILVNVNGVSVTRYLVKGERDEITTIDPTQIYVINP